MKQGGGIISIDLREIENIKTFYKKIKIKTQNQKNEYQIWNQNKIRGQIEFQSRVKLKINLKFTKEIKINNKKRTESDILEK